MGIEVFIEIRFFYIKKLRSFLQQHFANYHIYMIFMCDYTARLAYGEKVGEVGHENKRGSR